MRKSRFTGADHWDVEGTRSGGQGRGAVPAASGSTFGSRLIGAHPCQRRKKVLPPSTFSHHRQTKALNAFWRVLPGDGKWSSLPHQHLQLPYCSCDQLERNSELFPSSIRNSILPEAKISFCDLTTAL